MGRRGPKGEPTHLKVLRGVRPDRINHDEPEAPAGAPECPEWLDTEARGVWGAMVPILSEMGILTKIDGQALAIYCATYSRFIQATRKIAELGLVTDTARGGDRVSSYVRIAAEAGAEAKRLLESFGGTPSARSSLKVEAEKVDELAAFLAKRRG